MSHIQYKGEDKLVNDFKQMQNEMRNMITSPDKLPIRAGRQNDQSSTHEGTSGNANEQLVGGIQQQHQNMQQNQRMVALNGRGGGSRVSHQQQQSPGSPDQQLHYHYHHQQVVTVSPKPTAAGAANGGFPQSSATKARQRIAAGENNGGTISSNQKVSIHSQMQKYVHQQDDGVSSVHSGFKMLPPSTSNNYTTSNNAGLQSATISPIAANILNVKSASVVHPNYQNQQQQIAISMTESKPPHGGANPKMSGTLTYFSHHHPQAVQTSTNANAALVRNHNQQNVRTGDVTISRNDSAQLVEYNQQKAQQHQFARRLAMNSVVGASSQNNSMHSQQAAAPQTRQQSRDNQHRTAIQQQNQASSAGGIAMSAQSGLNRKAHIEGLHSSMDPPQIQQMTHSATFDNYKRHIQHHGSQQWYIQGGQQQPGSSSKGKHPPVIINSGAHEQQIGATGQNNSYMSGSTQRSLSHVVGAAGQNMMSGTTASASVEGKSGAANAIYERAARQHQALVNQHLSLQQAPTSASGPKSNNTSKASAVNPLDSQKSSTVATRNHMLGGKPPPSNSQQNRSMLPPTTNQAHSFSRSSQQASTKYSNGAAEAGGSSSGHYVQHQHHHSAHHQQTSNSLPQSAFTIADKKKTHSQASHNAQQAKQLPASTKGSGASQSHQLPPSNVFYHSHQSQQQSPIVGSPQQNMMQVRQYQQNSKQFRSSMQQQQQPPSQHHHHQSSHQTPLGNPQRLSMGGANVGHHHNQRHQQNNSGIVNGSFFDSHPHSAAGQNGAKNHAAAHAHHNRLPGPRKPAVEQLYENRLHLQKQHQQFQSSFIGGTNFMTSQTAAGARHHNNAAVGRQAAIANMMVQPHQQANASNTQAQSQSQSQSASHQQISNPATLTTQQAVLSNHNSVATPTQQSNNGQGGVVSNLVMMPSGPGVSTSATPPTGVVAGHHHQNNYSSGSHHGSPVMMRPTKANGAAGNSLNLRHHHHPHGDHLVLQGLSINKGNGSGT